MKSIVMSTQNVRDFLKERNLTLVKNFHDQPYESGDVVYIREPWFRMKGESERFVYSADMEDSSIYKWSSPVSMPAAAIRYYGRITFILRNAGAVGEWEIQLEAISKAEAEAAETGLPFSAAATPEEASDYFTYSGDMSPEDHEKMIATIDADRKRLSQVRFRLCIIDERLKVISQLLFEERNNVDPNDINMLHEENEALQNEQIELAYEEREIVSALEDAGVLDTAENTEAENATSQEATSQPTEPGEEYGSFTVGECDYCGRKWGVTLEGSPTGGYPTQKTANAAATRACNCEQADAHRAEILSVTFAVTTGICRYCGQVVEVGPHMLQKDADKTATEVCSCPEAKIERNVTEQIEEARDRVERLFGDSSEELGFKPIADKAPVSMLDDMVALIARRLISSATVQIRGQCKAKIGLTSKGKIKVSRSETRSYDLEAGE